MREILINWLIKILIVDTNKISDGYHTFGELYEHRIALFTLQLHGYRNSNAWKSKKHSDGSEWDGWFIAGLFKEKGLQITYHLPNRYWNSLRFVKELDKAPEWDGHTTNDVLIRLWKMTGN